MAAKTNRIIDITAAKQASASCLYYSKTVAFYIRKLWHRGVFGAVEYCSREAGAFICIEFRATPEESAAFHKNTVSRSYSKMRKQNEKPVLRFQTAKWRPPLPPGRKEEVRH